MKQTLPIYHAIFTISLKQRITRWNNKKDYYLFHIYIYSFIIFVNLVGLISATHGYNCRGRGYFRISGRKTGDKQFREGTRVSGTIKGCSGQTMFCKRRWERCTSGCWKRWDEERWKRTAIEKIWIRMVAWYSDVFCPLSLINRFYEFPVFPPFFHPFHLTDITVSFRKKKMFLCISNRIFFYFLFIERRMKKSFCKSIHNSFLIL